MDKRQCYTALNTGLNEELKESHLLYSVLKEEGAISHKDTEKLLSLLDHKKDLLVKLEQHHANRNALTKTYGFSPDHQGMESCIAWCDHNQQLSNKWANYLQLVSDCRNINQLNGSIMDSSLRTVKQALSILYGQQMNENTYNANGQEQSSVLGRSIAKA